MRLDEQCGRRAAAGKAGAADVPECEPFAEVPRAHTTQNALGQSLARATLCRAGFAGRGTALARSTGRNTLGSPFDPRQSLGSRS
jgi:hypothetical protein